MRPRPVPVSSPTRMEQLRADARAKWAAHLREKEMRERLELHRALAFGESSGRS